MHHAGRDAVFAEHRPILRRHQVHARDAHTGRGAAQVVNGNFGVAPTREGLFQSAGRSGVGVRYGWDKSRCGAGFEGLSSSHKDNLLCVGKGDAIFLRRELGRVDAGDFGE